jgi:hypothetical protein
MPIVQHPALELMPGDDWVIPFALTDVNGGPLDLTQAAFAWALLDPDGNSVANLVPTITTNSPASNGTGAIAINDAVTTDLLPGRYTDCLRVTITGAVSTVWVGFILVDANPFAQPAPPLPPTTPFDPTAYILPPWWAWPLPYLAWW